MDWYNTNDNLFEESEPSLSNTYHFDFDNFLIKNNSMNDFENKIDEFVFHKKDDLIAVPSLEYIEKESSKLESTQTKSLENKIFSITKSQKTKGNHESYLTQEKLAVHPFPISGTNQENNTLEAASSEKNTCLHSHENNIDSKIDSSYNKRNTDLESISSHNIDFPDYDSLVNNNSCIDIKRNLNQSDFPGQCFIPFGQLSISERMRIKKERTKLLLEKKTKREFFPFSYLNSTDVQSNNNIQDSSSNENNNESMYQLSKKETKMLRNRVSAQRSRDRKKKEMDSLKQFAQKLLDDNSYLKKELEEKENEITNIKESLSKLCSSCSNSFGFDTEKREPTVQVGGRYKVNDFSHSRLTTHSNRLRYSLMTGLFVVVCLIGTLGLGSIANDNKGNHVGRVLSEKDSSKELETPKSFTGLTVYQPAMQVKKTEGPFIITKQRKINDSKTKEMNFLSRKRDTFIVKMEEKAKLQNNEGGFLQSLRFNNQCINTDYLTIGATQELDLEDVLVEEMDYFHKEDYADTSSTIVPESPEESMMNQVVPIKRMRYENEKSLLNRNIRSMYCMDFITATGNNSELFQDLFNKLQNNQPLNNEIEWSKTSTTEEIK